MGLETGTQITDLVDTNPVGSVDAPSTLDGHIQLIKAVLQADAFGASTVHAATGKTTPVDADELPLVDSAASYVKKKLTWANLKATLKTYMDTLYAAYDADTAKLDVAQSWTAKQTFGTTVKFDEVLERITITGSAPTGTFDWLTQGVQYFTSDATASWTQNFRGDGSTTLNSLMATGEIVTVTVLATQGATPYYPSAHQVDGSSVTPKWLGGTAPSAGDASAINVYTYSIIKTADATFTVLASKSKYA